MARNAFVLTSEQHGRAPFVKELGKVIYYIKAPSGIEEGDFIRWDIPPSPFEFLPENVERLLGYNQPQGESGQGPLLRGIVNPQKTSPLLMDLDWTGGFMCDRGYARGIEAWRTRFHFPDTTMRPFISSKAVEDMLLAEGNLAELEWFRDEFLTPGIWYPMNLGEVKRAIAYGVFKLEQIDQHTGEGEGVLYFVFGDAWDQNVHEIALSKQDRIVGHAELIARVDMATYYRPPTGPVGYKY